MRYIFTNLKRFDVPPEFGGVNRLVVPEEWAREIITKVCGGLGKYWNSRSMEPNVSFTFFFPEAHIMQAVAAKGSNPIHIGCQAVHWEDIIKGGNFGAFTGSRPAAAISSLGSTAVIIGHCEERRTLTAVLAEGGLEGSKAASAVNRILAREIAAAKVRKLNILYCIGEKPEEQEQWQNILSSQIEAGLTAFNVSLEKSNALPLAAAESHPEREGSFIIGYEPVWAIGPGKIPPDRGYIEKIACFIKEKTNKDYGTIPVVYGGGLKTDNAEMLASIPEIDGGLIALTRFTGEIGFYPEEFLEIVDRYLQCDHA